MGEIIVGIAPGSILCGWLFPGAFDYVFRSASYGPMHILPQLGLILLMFQIGMEFEFTHLKARQHHQSVMRIAIAIMVVPFAAGYALGYGMTPVLSPGSSVHRQGIFDHAPAYS